MTREGVDAALGLLSKAGLVRNRNVLNPLLWLSFIVMSLCFAAGYAIGYHPWLGTVITLAALVPPLVTIIFYAVFAIRDPDRLQSEEFVARSMELRYQSKRHGAFGDIDSTRLPLRDHLTSPEDTNRGD